MYKTIEYKGSLIIEKGFRLMEDIVLIKPTVEYEDDIWKLRQEVLDSSDKDKFAGCGNLDECSSAKEWIETINLWESEETCPKGKVPSSIYIAVRKVDNRIVGVIDLRHHINNPILGVWGGHMGYYVRPIERQKGYAKEMLRINLQNCKDHNIEKVMISCDLDNLASEKTIIANGGVFEKNVCVDGDIIKRYWINLIN